MLAHFADAVRPPVRRCRMPPPRRWAPWPLPGQTRAPRARLPNSSATPRLLLSPIPLPRVARLNKLEGCRRHANGYVPGCEVCALHQQPQADIGRTSPAPMPSATMLDLARAEDVLGHTSDVGAVARYMSLDGVAAPREDPSPAVCVAQTPPTVSHDRGDVPDVCSFGRARRQRCQWCGGILVLGSVADVC